MGLILIGRIRTSFGLRGHVKIELTGHSAEKAGELKKVFAGPDQDSAVERKIEEIRVAPNGIVVKLQGIDDRNAADAARGWQLFLDESAIEPPPDGSFRVHELLECAVVDRTGKWIGRIEDIIKTPGHDIWVVRDGDRTVNVPAVKAHVLKVDIGGRTVTIASAEGLEEA